MRTLIVIPLLLGLAGCAAAPERPRHEGWHGDHRGGPDGAGGEGMRGGLFISPMGEPFRGEGREALISRWFAGADADHDGRLTPAEFRADAMRFFHMLDTDGDGEIGPDEIEHYENVIAPEIRTGGMGGGRGGGGRPAGGGRGHGGGMHGGGMHGGGMGGGRMGGDGDGEAEGGSGESAPNHAMAEMPRGAGRFGFFDIPEPVVSADSNLDRGISAQEFEAAARQRFTMLDVNHDGVIMRDELPKRSGGR
jgi:Ca2+-binding EF-hand superfamily protein